MENPSPAKTPNPDIKPVRPPGVAYLYSFGCGLVLFLILIAITLIGKNPKNPETPLPVSSDLMSRLGTNAPPITAFYQHDLGGFIDHEWLWRIDAPPETIQFIISQLKLQPTNSIPAAFWEMEPRYWPRSLPARAETFQSPGFMADSRGNDGRFYFLLHDKRQSKAYIWFKDNF